MALSHRHLHHDQRRVDGGTAAPRVHPVLLKPHNVAAAPTPVELAEARIALQASRAETRDALSQLAGRLLALGEPGAGRPLLGQVRSAIDRLAPRHFSGSEALRALALAGIPRLDEDEERAVLLGARASEAQLSVAPALMPLALVPSAARVARDPVEYGADGGWEAHTRLYSHRDVAVLMLLAAPLEDRRLSLSRAWTQEVVVRRERRAEEARKAEEKFGGEGGSGGGGVKVASKRPSRLTGRALSAVPPLQEELNGKVVADKLSAALQGTRLALSAEEADFGAWMAGRGELVTARGMQVGLHLFAHPAGW